MEITQEGCVLFCLFWFVLWHINHCRLLMPNPFLYIHKTELFEIEPFRHLTVYKITIVTCSSISNNSV